MAKEKKLVEAITSMEEDFTQWYTDVVKKAELMDYSSVKGCMIFKPNGYAIWENIQKNLDAMFKETGVENVYMPMFIPESLLQKEKDHVEGFAPEVAWVTQGGLETLQESDSTYEATDMVGKDGLEQYYESELAGTKGNDTVYLNNVGQILDTIDSEPSVRGNDVYLTIDLDLHDAVYNIM